MKKKDKDRSELLPAKHQSHPAILRSGHSHGKSMTHSVALGPKETVYMLLMTFYEQSHPHELCATETFAKTIFDNLPIERRQYYRDKGGVLRQLKGSKPVMDNDVLNKAAELLRLDKKMLDELSAMNEEARKEEQIRRAR